MNQSHQDIWRRALVEAAERGGGIDVTPGKADGAVVATTYRTRVLWFDRDEEVLLVERFGDKLRASGR